MRALEEIQRLMKKNKHKEKLIKFEKEKDFKDS